MSECECYCGCSDYEGLDFFECCGLYFCPDCYDDHIEVSGAVHGDWERD